MSDDPKPKEQSTPRDTNLNPETDAYRFGGFRGGFRGCAAYGPDDYIPEDSTSYPHPRTDGLPSNNT
jgi:hypothetical protein